MKNLFLILFFFLPFIGNSQVYLENTNSKNAYDVVVYKNGKIIHSHIMVPGDIIEINATHLDRLKIKFKRLTSIPDSYSKSRKTELINQGFSIKKVQGYTQGGYRCTEIVGAYSFLGVFLERTILVLPKYTVPGA